MKNFIATLFNSKLEKDNGAEGPSVSVDLKIGSDDDDGEQWYPPGFICIPQDNIQGVGIKVDNQNIIVSNQNYGFDKEDLDKGSPMIYGFDKDGKVKCFVLADSDGLLTLKTELDSLKEWQTRVLRAFIDHFDSTGAPTYHNNLGPILSALLETEITNLDNIFKE